ncbi:MAG: type II toxin-antitoxin system RelE/ParE family toxin [Lachnospiraceae bacterium]|nr:type II toxin-antitoxin system RelE/ParE family toxin [Lachnospiraceae bacterium]
MIYKKCKVVIARSGKEDIAQKKKYIIQHFKYREYAESYSQMIKEAARKLERLPLGYRHTGFQYRGYDIYMKPVNGHILFFTVNENTAIVTLLRVLQDDMDWQNIIKQWIQENS